MMNPYFNDKKKLDDAIALARSFSKAKPAQSKGKPKGPAYSQGQFQNHLYSPGPGHFQNQRGPPPTAQRQPFTQTIVRKYANPFDTVQAISRAFSVPGSQSVRVPGMAKNRPPTTLQRYARHQNAIPITAWQGQTGAASITGGRALDFLSRKDVVQDDVPAQPAATAAASAEASTAPPTAGAGDAADIFNQILMAQPEVTKPAANPVLEEFHKLMAQTTEEDAETEMLIQQMRKWNP